MPLNQTQKTQAVIRVRPIKGQLEALEQALAGEADCALVLQRLKVIRGAINGLMVLILGHYLEEEFSSDNVNRDLRTKSLDEMIALMHSYLR